MSYRNVATRSLSALRRHALALVTVTLAVSIPTNAALAAVDPTRGWGGDVGWNLTITWWLLPAFPYAFVAGVVSLIAAASAASPVQAAVVRATRVLPTLVLVTLVVTAGVAAGLLLLLIPGLVLLAWWALSIQVVVFEDNAWWRVFGRSREVVRGYAGGVLITTLSWMVITLAIDYAMWRLVGAGFVAATASGVVFDLVGLPLTVVLTHLYLELRHAPSWAR